MAKGGEELLQHARVEETRAIGGRAAEGEDERPALGSGEAVSLEVASEQLREKRMRGGSVVIATPQR